MKKRIKALLFSLVLFSGGLMLISRSIKAVVSKEIVKEELAALLPGHFSQDKAQKILNYIFAGQHTRKLTQQSLRALLRSAGLTVSHIDTIIQEIFGQNPGSAV